MANPATSTSDAPPKRTDGLAAPLQYPVFRSIWTASLLSNLGLLIQGVGAAWTMTQLTTDAGLVASVQTAQMLPVMLLALTAGAIADMYDRRVVIMCALSVSLAGATCLAVMAGPLHLTSPAILLFFCFIIGSGSALFQPAWQASVSEQVPGDILPSAVALNSISYNIARSFGPAIGGLIVAAWGSVAAFGANALFYLPLLYVVFRWKRVQQPSRLPPERLGRAMVSGVRYIANSPPIRVVVLRTLIVGFLLGPLWGLMPLIASKLLHGTAETYGLLLGAFGIGSVIAAFLTPRIRRALSAEAAVSLFCVLIGASMVISAISRLPALTAAAMFVAGGSWMLTSTNFNIGVQFSAPRWVAGRALASYQAAVAGGIAMGAWAWGQLANHIGLEATMIVAAAGLLLSPLLRFVLKMPRVGGRNEDSIEVLPDPEVSLALTGRSGPIIIEIEYFVEMDQARAFYRAMQEVQRIRTRNGGYDWSLSRDIGNPELWIETYVSPTWHDYLRQRTRTTQAEREAQNYANTFHKGDGRGPQIRRRLDRPLGSVRWKDEAPDTAPGEIIH